MRKIVFFCIPAHGHTNPTLGVVRELVSRGHQVWYYSYSFLREKIEAAGAIFVSCDDYNIEQKLSPADSARMGKDLAFSTRILTDTTLALDDKVCADMKILKPDCIVASTTTFAFNQASAKIMKQSIGEMMKMLFALPKVQKDVRRLQKKGYPVKNILDILQNDNQTHTIVYTSPEFQPCAETFSDRYVFVGPSIRPVTQSIEKTREKLIYISMGTVNNNLLSFYKTCLSAFENTPYQVILSVGNLVSLNEFGKLPEHISVFSHVDQIAVLKKADIFISHSGMNSVNESLYFGVPLIMLPQTSEQSGVAERVSQLGAGIRLHKPDADAIRNAVEKIFADGSYKQNACKISDGFQKCSGVKGAADKILQVCKTDTL